MKINAIKDIHVFRDEDVVKEEENWLLVQPDRPKEELGMFNYWSEQKRKNISNDAVTMRLILDYDDGPRRADIEKKFEDFEYMIYNSAGNKESEGIEKFRVILALERPLSADDLRWWRSQSKFKDYFKGVDESSFAIGRFFYRPSKFDKDRKPVVVSIHKGVKFDFNKLFSGRTGIEMLEAVKEKMQRSKESKKVGKQEEVFDEWVKRRFPGGVHYPDICSFCLRASSCGLTEEEAELKFDSIYVGHSDWRKNFKKVYGDTLR